MINKENLMDNENTEQMRQEMIDSMAKKILDENIDAFMELAK